MDNKKILFFLGFFVAFSLIGSFQFYFRGAEKADAQIGTGVLRVCEFAASATTTDKDGSLAASSTIVGVLGPSNPHLVTTCSGITNGNGTTTFNTATSSATGGSLSFPPDLSTSTPITFFPKWPVNADMNTATVTTPVIFIGDSRNIDIMLAMQASTTAGLVSFTYEFSNNGVDFYGEEETSYTRTSDGAAALGEKITHNPTEGITHTWIPGVTTLVKKYLRLQDVNARYFRMNIDMGGATSTLYFEIGTRD